MTSPPSVTPPFLTKLYALVDEPSTNALVSWLPLEDMAARLFTVHKPSDFAADVLPRHFKHNNFSSFVRQLNQYGFHKQDPDRWTFAHDSFRRGRTDLLAEISRRRPKAQPAGTVATAMDPANIAALGGYIGAGGGFGGVKQQNRVVELGNYGGIDGVFNQLDALKRDKDLLVRELVVTRNAETKLKGKCDSLERRVDSLEHSSKQMQTFILHYFSQVLQPYNAPMTSRKRKRLPSTVSADMADVPGADDAAPAAQNLALSQMPTGPTMETLLSMLQQMQLPAGAAADVPLPGGAGVPQPPLYASAAPDLLRGESYAPAMVQELAQDYDDGVVNPSAAVVAATQAMFDASSAAAIHANTNGMAAPRAAGMPPGLRSDDTAAAAVIAANGRGLGTATPPPVGSASTAALAAPPGPGVSPLAAPLSSSPTTSAGQAGDCPGVQSSPVLAVPKFEDAMTGSLYGPSASTDKYLNLRDSGTPPDLATNPGSDFALKVATLAPSEAMSIPSISTGRMLDDILDMEKSVEMFPPLSELPQGTDISALARQVENLTNAEAGGLGEG